jgi:hypothetical protein
MFCPKCGLNNEDDARFCANCGERMTDPVSQTAPRSGPDWRDFNGPTMPAGVPPVMPQPMTPPPMPFQTPVLPPAAQVIIGAPARPSAFSGIFLLFSVVALIGAMAFAVIRLVDVNIDTSSWPLIGDDSKKETRPGEGILVSINGPCKDANGQPCNVILDITALKVTPANTEVTYEARATGQTNCQVALPPDQDAVKQQEAAGKPGPYLEGGRGRYYPLLSSTGFLATGGTLTCNKVEKGVWLFQPIGAETSIKLRYPSIPPARIDIAAPPVGKVLPPDDPISVIPVQSTSCTTAQNQPCQARWEIGPYGVGIDGSPTVFFSVRFDGPPNCSIPWQPLLAVHQREIAAQRKGIHLALVGNPPGELTLTGTGGMASSVTQHPCGQVLSGFLRFAPGNLSPTVNLMFWEFPPVQMPIKP